MTFQNVLSRLSELGLVRSERRGRGGRERVLLPGPSFDAISGLETELRDAAIGARSAWQAPRDSATAGGTETARR